MENAIILDKNENKEFHLQDILLDFKIIKLKSSECSGFLILIAFIKLRFLSIKNQQLKVKEIFTKISIWNFSSIIPKITT